MNSLKFNSAPGKGCVAAMGNPLVLALDDFNKWDGFKVVLKPVLLPVGGIKLEEPKFTPKSEGVELLDRELDERGNWF